MTIDETETPALIGAEILNRNLRTMSADKVNQPSLADLYLIWRVNDSGK